MKKIISLSTLHIIANYYTLQGKITRQVETVGRYFTTFQSYLACFDPLYCLQPLKFSRVIGVLIKI